MIWQRYFDRSHPKHEYVVNRFNWIMRRVKGTKLLDIGCSNGLGVYLASKRVKRVYGIDICKESIDEAKENCKDRDVNLWVGNAEEMIYPDEMFDCVIMGEVLEHVDSDVKVINEAYRVLARRGTLIVTIPEKGALSKQHKRIYTKASVSKLLKKFNIKEITRMKSSKIDYWILIRAEK